MSIEHIYGFRLLICATAAANHHRRSLIIYNVTFIYTVDLRLHFALCALLY